VNFSYVLVTINALH